MAVKKSRKGKAGSGKVKRKATKATPRRSSKKLQPLRTKPQPQGGRLCWLEEFKDRREALMGHLRDGARPTQACVLVGLPKQRYSEWKKHGTADIMEGKESIYSQFADDVALSQAFHFKEMQDDLIAAIRPHEVRVVETTTTPTSIITKERFQEVSYPTLLLDYISRINPPEWSAKQEIQHSGQIETVKRIILQGPDPTAALPPPPGSKKSGD
jgi:hypothetical protein